MAAKMLQDALEWNGSSAQGQFATAGFVVPLEAVKLRIWLQDAAFRSPVDVPVALHEVAELLRAAKAIPGRGKEIPAAALSLPKDFVRETLPDILSRAVRGLDLGYDGTNFGARFVGLRVYNMPGRFNLHASSDNADARTFATLIVELPTLPTLEHPAEGGLVLAGRGNETKTFSSARPLCGFFFSASFSCCEYTLYKDTPSPALCLAFNVVAKDMARIPGFPAALYRTEQALAEVFANNAMAKKLVIPLQYSYSKPDFSDLKGGDSIAVELLKNVKGKVRLRLCDYTNGRTSKHHDEFDVINFGSLSEDQLLRRVSSTGEDQAGGDEQNGMNLIVWPASNDAYIISSYSSFSSTLDVAEQRMEPEFLDQILDALSEIGSSKSRYIDAYRLFELCRKLGNQSHFLKALEVLGSGQISDELWSGARSAEACKLLALAVRSDGWYGYAGAVLNNLLREERLQDGLRSYAFLSIALKKLGFSTAAGQVAVRTLELCPSSVQSLTVSNVLVVWKMILRVLESEYVPEFLQLLKDGAATDVLCSLVLSYETLVAMGISKQDPTLHTLFSMLAERQLVEVDAKVLDVKRLWNLAEAYQWLDCPDAFDAFKAALGSQLSEDSNKGELLKSFLKTGSWKIFSCADGLIEAFASVRTDDLCTLLEMLHDDAKERSLVGPTATMSRLSEIIVSRKDVNYVDGVPLMEALVLSLDNAVLRRFVASYLQHNDRSMDKMQQHSILVDAFLCCGSSSWTLFFYNPRLLASLEAQTRCLFWLLWRCKQAAGAGRIPWSKNPTMRTSFRMLCAMILSRLEQDHAKTFRDWGKLTTAFIWLGDRILLGKVKRIARSCPRAVSERESWEEVNDIILELAKERQSMQGNAGVDRVLLNVRLDQASRRKRKASD